MRIHLNVKKYIYAYVYTYRVPGPTVLEPNFYLPWPKLQLQSQCLFLLLKTQKSKNTLNEKDGVMNLWGIFFMLKEGKC